MIRGGKLATPPRSPHQMRCAGRYPPGCSGLEGFPFGAVVSASRTWEGSDAAHPCIIASWHGVTHAETLCQLSPLFLLPSLFLLNLLLLPPTSFPFQLCNSYAHTWMGQLLVLPPPLFPALSLFAFIPSSSRTISMCYRKRHVAS